MPIATLLRMATDADAAAIATIYAPFCESSAISFEEVAPSAGEIGGRIAKTTRQLPWLVLDVDGEIAGYAYASAHRDRAAYRWSVDSSVYVAAASRRRGTARALYTTLFQLLRDQGYFKVHAGVTLPNDASIGVHEAMGFKFVGTYRGVGYKRRAWHDVAWYQLVLRPETNDPPEPRPIALIAPSEWRAAVSAGLTQYRP